MLTHLFSVFDKLTTELEIYKVCTIGDAYVRGGLPLCWPRRSIQSEQSESGRSWKYSEPVGHRSLSAIDDYYALRRALVLASTDTFR